MDVDLRTFLQDNYEFPLKVCNALARQGIVSFDSVKELRTKDDINMLSDVLRCPGGTVAQQNVAVPNPGVEFPYHYSVVLDDLAYVLRMKDNESEVFDPKVHGPAILAEYREHRTYFTEKTDATKPDKFVQANKFRETKDSIDMYLSSTRGISGVFLSYVVRPNFAPGAAPADGWGSIDEKMVARAPLQGPAYQVDCKAVYHVLYGCFSGTDAAVWIQAYAASRDGRAAYLRLESHYFGDSQRLNPRYAAESTMRNLRYESEARMPFSTFVRQHQQAYNDCKLAGKTITEEDRIYYLSNGIRAGSLKDVHAQLILDQPFLDTFDKCEAFLSSIISDRQSMAADERGDRNVSGIEPKSGGGKRQSKIAKKRYSKSGKPSNTKWFTKSG